MKSLNQRNLIKGKIATVVGAAVWGIVLVCVARGLMTWMWEGTIGMGVGAILFFASDRMRDYIDDAKKYLTRNNNNNDDERINS